MAIDRFQDYDLNLLVVLHVLLEERNVSGAAKRLGVAQSAASRSLARLREQLGDELLVRTGRRMALTPRAESMKEPLRKLLLDTGTLLFTAQEVDQATLARTFPDRQLGLPHGPAAAAPGCAPRGTGSARAHRRAPASCRLRRRAHRQRTRPGRDAEADASAGVVWTPLMQDRLVTVSRRGHPRLADTLCLEDYLAERHVRVVPDGGSKTRTGGPGARTGRLES